MRSGSIGEGWGAVNRVPSLQERAGVERLELLQNMSVLVQRH